MIDLAPLTIDHRRAIISGIYDAIRRTPSMRRDGIALTLAERNPFGGTDHYTVYGRNIIPTGTDQVAVMGTGWTRYYNLDSVTAVATVSAALVLDQYGPGDRIRVRRYGDDYRAEVISTGRTNMVVEFRTIGGKWKRTTVAALDVVPARGAVESRASAAARHAARA